MSQLFTKHIVFLGAGSMAEAILRGLIEKQKSPSHLITMMNHQNTSRLSELQQRYGVNSTSDPAVKKDLIQSADIIVLAMKPKDATSALQEINSLVNDNQMLISVIAGLTIQTIQGLLQRQIPVVRTMPNTSSTIGLGATGISFSDELSDIHKKIALDMFSSIGIAVEVDESQMDMVTGISGCGPAYIYYLMESMITAGLEGGLTAEVARALTIQTVLGAAQMVQSTQENPAELRRKVTSPGGATQAAIETLDSFSFSTAIAKAIQRAAERSSEMGTAISNQSNK